MRILLSFNKVHTDLTLLIELAIIRLRLISLLYTYTKTNTKSCRWCTYTWMIQGSTTPSLLPLNHSYFHMGKHGCRELHPADQGKGDILHLGDIFHCNNSKPQSVRTSYKANTLMVSQPNWIQSSKWMKGHLFPSIHLFWFLIQLPYVPMVPVLWVLIVWMPPVGGGCALPSSVLQMISATL